MTKLKKVCVIDDDEIFVFAFKKILRISGFCEDVTVYFNGKEAINGITSSNEDLDLIFLDINMPVMDGWGFLEQLEQQNIDHSTPIYLLTSSIDQYDKIRAEQSRLVSKYLVKPLSVEDLTKLEV